MSKKQPICANENCDAFGGNSHNKAIRIKVARNFEDMARVLAIRSAVYLSEQSCPYGEEFDGNDFCGMHLIAVKAEEPIGCIRIRFFCEFAKLERLAVRHEFRNSRASFQLVSTAIELARKKGYHLIYGHAQNRLINFWSHFGAKPLDKNYSLSFSDFDYTEMFIEVAPHPEAITIHSDPYIIIRPEGEWHQPGILDASSKRPTTSPLRDLNIA